MGFQFVLGAATLAIFVWGCKGSVDEPSNGVGGTGGAGGSTGPGTTSSSGTMTGSGGACAGVEPVLASNACAPTDASCHSATNACFAQVEYGGAKDFGMRIVHIRASKPDMFTEATFPVIAGIFDQTLAPSLPQCQIKGEGNSAWLLHFDLWTGKLTVGSAAFVGSGSSALKFDASSAVGGFGVDFPMAPATVDVAVDGDCQFQSSPAEVTLRIFLTSPADYFLIPLVQATISGQLSPAHNCIGAVDPGTGDPDSCWSEYKDGGSISGLIPLRAADDFHIVSLKRTLCSFLVNESNVLDDNYVHHCLKDAAGEVMNKGDACIATGGPATPDCADAMFFEAQFTAAGADVVK